MPVTRHGCAMRRPPRVFCVDCGDDLGRGWNEHARCDNCKAELAESRADDDGPECSCGDMEWEESCELHQHDPYDIQF